MIYYLLALPNHQRGRNVQDPPSRRRARRALAWIAGTSRQPPIIVSSILKGRRKEADAVLLLPIITLLLGPGDLSLKVFSLDIDLA
jgi:hypothetical protein